MSIRLVSSINGVTRIDFDGRIAERALEIGSQVLPTKDLDFRDKLLANFREEQPLSMKKVPAGAGVPRGYYVFDTYTGGLRAFLANEKAQLAAESDLKAARFYGAGRKKGVDKVFNFNIEIDGASVRFEGTHADMRNIIRESLLENSRLNARVSDLESKLSLATRAAQKLRDQMLESGQKPRYRVRAGNFVSVADPSTLSSVSPQEFRT